MCYKGKIFNCIPVKPVCFVLAILNAIIDGITLVWYVFFWGLLIMAVGIFLGDLRLKRDVSDHLNDYYAEIAIFSFFAIPLILLLNFIFSAILCNGINNLKPRQVKAYFWYGVVCNIVVFIIAMVMLAIHSGPQDPVPMETRDMGTWLLVKCTLQSLFLILIHHTHKKVVEEAMFVDHVPLVEVRGRDTV